MLSFTQNRIKRYKHPVFTKITDEQLEGLKKLSADRNIPVSELLRDFIQAAIEPNESDTEASLRDDIRIGLELLQTVRMELVSLAACQMDNVKQVSSEAEEVAALELAGFKERRKRRMDLVKSLGGEHA